MKNTHTPELWRALIDSRTSIIGIVSESGIHITDVHGYGALRTTNEANAWLIAAAPGLLKTCTRILHSLNWERPGDKLTTEEMAKILHAAIEKASGND